MKNLLRTLFIILQISIIVFAVVLSVIRLGVPFIDGYEQKIEGWFEEQGVKAEMSRIALRFDGFKPEIFINGLIVKDEENKSIMTLNSATLRTNLLQSLLNQQLIIDKADFFISKAVIDVKLFQSEKDAESFQLSPKLLQSLMALNHFTLSIEQIDIIDKADKTYSIYKTELSLKGKDSKKQLMLNSSLLQKKETMLSGQFALDLSQLSKQKRLLGNGFFTINTSSLNQIDLLKNYSLTGDMMLNNWVDFNADLTSMVSQIKAQKVSFTANGKTHQLNTDTILKTEFINDVLSFSVDSKKLLLNKLDLSALKLTAQSSLELGKFVKPIALIENVVLSDIQKLVSFLPELKTLKKYSTELKPKGHIQQLLASAPSLDQLDQTQIDLNASDLQWKAYQGIPGVNKIALNLVAGAKSFQADVSSKGLKVWPADLYTHSFSVNRLKAKVNGTIGQNSLLIDVPDIAIQQKTASIDGRLKINVEKNASPYLFMRLQAKNANIQIVSPFLPQKLMGKDVLQWVTSSVKKADVKTADVLYAGRLENNVNFDEKNNGIFETALKLEDVNLHYEENWPILQAPKVDLTFKNYQLIARSPLTYSQGLKAKEVAFTIANLNKPKAQLSLNLNEQLDKQWAFLSNSPIKNDIPYFNDITDLKGDVKTFVDAEFPLLSDIEFEPQFNVKLIANKAGFALEKLGVLISDINGDILVTQDGISVAPTNVNWYGQPITMNVTYDNDATYLKMHGDQLDVASLLNTLPASVLDHVSGKSAWDVNAVIYENPKNLPIVSIEAHTGLKGIAVHLPLPMSIDADETRHLKVKVDIYESEDLGIQLSLDKRVQAKLKLKKDANDQYFLWGGNVQFGSDLVADILAKDLRINGEIEELNVDHWVAYLSSDETDEVSAFNNQYLTQIKSIDLSINQLQVKNISAKQVVLKVGKEKTGLKGTLQSSVAKGRFYLPLFQSIDVPINIDLDMFNVVLKEGLGESDKVVYKTDQLPNLVFKSKLFSVNGKNFSDAYAEIETHNENKFLLKKLSLKHQDVTLDASGAWIFNNTLKQHVSRLKISINGEKIGQTLDNLGLGKSIENGQVTFSGDLSWPDTLWNLDLDKAQGSATIKIKDGYLLDVDPAEGRFVGLLSLSALPRRLTLDFSDFFKEGLQFDRITGDFSIHDGSMWTTNLNMTGSVSDVNIVGRTGIKAKDYDQMITIIPQVRDALPVIGSIVAGSTVGWAMLLFQRLFKDPIDDSVSIKYKVTGHWDAPKIELIEKPKDKVSSEDIKISPDSSEL